VYAAEEIRGRSFSPLILDRSPQRRPQRMSRQATDSVVLFAFSTVSPGSIDTATDLI